MAQHKQSRRAVLRSALKHKRAADTLLSVIEGMTTAIAAARAKIAADTNLTWDVDYVSTVGVTSVDFDEPTIGQHKASIRKILIDKMTSKRMGNDISDILEEAQVTLNLVLAQMDADAGTLSADGVYEAFRITDVLDIDAEEASGPRKTAFRKVMRSALCHKTFGDSLSEEIAAIQQDINAMITEIQAKN